MQLRAQRSCLLSDLLHLLLEGLSSSCCLDMTVEKFLGLQKTAKPEKLTVYHSGLHSKTKNVVQLKQRTDESMLMAIA